jgi:soluble lytic murein transglycosylase-like protein
MFRPLKFASALVWLVCIAFVCTNGTASALTAELARKCAALTARAYPPQRPSHPAAGLAKGMAQTKRDYFNKCVANGGNVHDDAPEHPPVSPSDGAVSVTRRDRTSELSESLCPLIQSVAAQNGLPVEFFARLIWQESRLRPDAVGPVTRSGKRAQGIAQFMPATAAERFLLDAFDPAQALPKSAEFLRELRAKFGNLGLAAAAYNAGPQRVQDWLSGKRTLPSETLSYVRSVTGHSAEAWKRPDAQTWQVSVASDTPCLETTPLVAKAAPVAPSKPPGPSAAWAVQLIGDRLEASALSRYAQLQRKYQAILGGREPLLMRTTMGNAAIWHRVSVAADTREAAETLCSRLRAAGGSCLIQSN